MISERLFPISGGFNDTSGISFGVVKAGSYYWLSMLAISFGSFPYLLPFFKGPILLVHFLYLFEYLWMLVTVNNLKHMVCHESHALRIWTNGTFLTQTLLSVSNETNSVLVVGILGADWWNTDKTLLSARPETEWRRRKRKNKGCRKAFCVIRKRKKRRWMP